MTPKQYKRALDGDSMRELNAAYCEAQKHAFDLRFTPAKRQAAREFLPALTAEMRKRIEASGRVSA